MVSSMLQKLPIGVQSFAHLRQEGYLYVDKTKYIHELVNGSKQYFLSRPRRFGKSLFLSTLKAYWQGQKELFSGLYIAAEEEKSAHPWQAYPVFVFDFNGKNYQKAQALENVLDEKLHEWEQEYALSGTQSLEERFRLLLAAAKEKSGRPCVVLVDEYDKPLLDVMADETLAEHNKAVFKGFFGVLKSCDEYLQFVFITGVTKFSKVSIFSDLNHLKDISMNKKYAAVCGITENELTDTLWPQVEKFAEVQDKTTKDCQQKLRRTYDGYHFHPQGEGVYNPFSLLNALDDGELRSYWFVTGTPTFLIKKLQDGEFDLWKFTDGKLYSDERALADYRADNPDILPLLYQTGYLTIVGYDDRRQRLTMGFPNEEVKYGFLESLMPAYAPKAVPGTDTDIFTLDDYVENGNVDGIRQILTALFASIPYTSAGTRFEHYFATVIYLVFTLLGKYVHSEVHNSQGRADCILETVAYVYIFEFKLDKSAQAALAQIEEKGYALPYAADKRKIYRIGVNFSSESRNIAAWEVCE